MKWISVKDERPKCYKRILAFCSHMGIHVAWMAVDDDGQDKYTIAFLDRILDDVTHWAELPEKPTITPMVL